MNRQRLILAILLALLICAVGYSFFRFPHQERVESSGAPAAVPAKKSNHTPGMEGRVRLDLLERNGAGFTGFKKNIFAPIFRDLSKLPPVKRVTPAPPPPPPPLPPPPPPVALPTVSPLERELAQFTFLGLLEKERKKTIFLSKNKEIFLVKKGDRIAGKYEATAITDDALTIRVLGGENTEIVIPLVDNQTLKAPPQGSSTLPSPQSPRSRRPDRNIPPRPAGELPVVEESP